MHRSVWIAVEPRVGVVELQRERVHHVGRNVSENQSRDVSKGIGSVIRTNGLHVNLVNWNLQSIDQTLRHVSENLRGRQRRCGNELVRQIVVESKLDEGRVCWLAADASIGSDDLR